MLSAWPRKTAPQNPETCLLTTARHSFIDFFCHQRVVLASEPPAPYPNSAEATGKDLPD